MVEPDDEAPPEGWHVPQRLPTIAAILTPLVLLGVLIAAGTFYDRRLRPQRLAPVHTFPAPGIETFVHGGVKEPRLRAVPPPIDPAAVHAADALVKHGLPGWRAQ